MTQAEGKVFRRLLVFHMTVLMSGISMQTHAQDENETCPCFSYEEVESIFLMGEKLTADEGFSTCNAEDYSVECKAEVVVYDQNYDLIAQARVVWYDFDPGRCDYINATVDSEPERKENWPHPAPEAVARACFNIISRVIENSDTSDKCTTYP